MNIPKILVIGGTGTMGKPLVSELYSKKYYIDVLCRHQVVDNRNIRYLIGDAKDNAFMKKVLSEYYDVIVDFCMYSSQEFRLNYISLLKATKHYICLSSAAVYADDNEPKSEEFPRYMEIDPPVFGEDKYMWYCYEKARIEDILRTSKYNNWTIIRPGMTMNDNHFFWGDWIDEEWCFRILHNKKVVIPKDMLKYKASITYGGDITQMILAVISMPEAIGQIYNVTSTNVFSWEELLHVYQKAFEKNGYAIKIHYVESSEEILKYYPGMRYVYERARLLDRVFDSSKIYKLMGSYCFTSVEEKIQEWVSDYINKKPQKIRSIKVFSTASIDKITGENTSILFFESLKDYSLYFIYRYIPIIIPAMRTIKHTLNNIIEKK